MKYVIIFILLLSALSLGQYNESIGSITLTLTNSDSSYVYAARSWSGYTYLSTTVPTVDVLKSARWATLKSVVVVPTAGTGTDASTETDSLSIYIDGMVYDATNQTWAAFSGDRRYLKFAYIQTTLRAPTWIDWTSASVNICPMLDSLINPVLDNASAYRFYIRNRNAGSGIATVKLIPIWSVDPR